MKKWIRTEMGVVAYEIDAPDENLGNQFTYYSNGYVKDKSNYTDESCWYRNEIDVTNPYKSYKLVYEDCVTKQGDNLIDVLEDNDLFVKNKVILRYYEWWMKHKHIKDKTGICRSAIYSEFETIVQNAFSDGWKLVTNEQYMPLAQGVNNEI